MAALVVVAALMGLLAWAVFASFPAPPGVQCPIPDGVSVGAALTAADHTQVLLVYPLSAIAIGGTGDGLIEEGCTLTQDTVQVYVDGPRSSYQFNVSQYVQAYRTVTSHANNSTIVSSIPYWADDVHHPVTISDTPWTWASVTYDLPPAPELRNVTISLMSNNSSVASVSWTFLHLTPASLLPINGNIGAAWSVSIELFLVGTVTATLAFLVGRVTIQRLGVKPNMKKVGLALIGGIVYYLILIASDWSGVTWDLGSLASYVAVAVPAFVVTWLVGIPMGESWYVKARRHLPDVADQFEDRGGGR